MEGWVDLRGRVDPENVPKKEMFYEGHETPLGARRSEQHVLGEERLEVDHRLGGAVERAVIHRLSCPRGLQIPATDSLRLLDDVLDSLQGRR